MSILIPKKKFYTFKGQPQTGSVINFNHPIAKGLKCCSLFNNTRKAPFDLVKPRGIVQTGAGNWLLVKSGWGCGNWTLGTATQTGDLDFVGLPFTVAAFFYATGGPGAGNAPDMFSRYNYVSESDNEGWGIGINGNSSDQFTFNIFRDNAAASYRMNGTTSCVRGDWFVAGTSDATTRRLYVNGKQENSSVTNGTPVTQITNGIRAVTSNVNPRVYIGYVWNRELSPLEIRQLSINPYLFIAPKKRNVFFPSSSIKSSTASPALVTTKVLINTATARISKSLTVTPSLARVSISVNSPTISIKSSVIAFDATSNSGYQAAQSTYSWSHTCAGNNRYLTVGISMLSIAQTVSSITYNSVPLTLLGSRSSVTGACRTELWGLVAPTLGSNTIQVTLSGSIASAGIASSYTGVNQAVSTEDFKSNQATNGLAADATVDVPTFADNDWCVDILATDDTAITVGAGQTERGNVSGAGGSGAMSTEGPKTPFGTVTMSWTNVAALATWSISSIALRPLSSDTPVLPSTAIITLKVNTAVASVKRIATPSTAYVTIKVNAATPSFKANAIAVPSLKTVTIKVNAVTASAYKNATAASTLNLVKVLVNTPTLKITRSAFVSATIALVTLKINSATVTTGSSSSSTATPSQARVTILVKSAVASTGGIKIALPTTAFITVKINAPTAKVIKHSTATSSLNLVSVLVKSATVVTSKSAIASNTLVTTKVLVNSATAKVIKNAFASPGAVALIKILVNTPTLRISASRTATPQAQSVRIFISSPTISTGTAQVVLTIQILLQSQIEKSPVFKSRIEKYINMPSQMQTREVSKSRVTKYINQDSQIEKSIIGKSKILT